MKCILVVATVFVVVWLFSVVVPAVGCKFRRLWGRLILVPLGYGGKLLEDDLQEEHSSRKSHESHRSHGTHRSHDSHDSHHDIHRHSSSPSLPFSDTDDGAGRRDDANVPNEMRAEDVSAMKEAKNHALRHGRIVEAYYWLLLAELAGATDVASELRKLRGKWIAHKCPREYENERSDFTRNQGSFARAVLHLHSGKDYARSCRKIGRLARCGLPEAKRFAERYKISVSGSDSRELLRGHHGQHRSA